MVSLNICILRALCFFLPSCFPQVKKQVSDSDVTAGRSPTISLLFRPMVPDARERALTVDMALYLSRTHQESVSLSFVTPPLTVESSTTHFRLPVPRTLQERQLNQRTPAWWALPASSSAGDRPSFQSSLRMPIFRSPLLQGVQFDTTEDTYSCFIRTH